MSGFWQRPTAAWMTSFRLWLVLSELASAHTTSYPSTTPTLWNIASPRWWSILDITRLALWNWTFASSRRAGQVHTLHSKETLSKSWWFFSNVISFAFVCRKLFSTLPCSRFVWVKWGTPPREESAGWPAGALPNPRAPCLLFSVRLNWPSPITRLVIENIVLWSSGRRVVIFCSFSPHKTWSARKAPARTAARATVAVRLSARSRMGRSTWSAWFPGGSKFSIFSTHNSSGGFVSN